MNNNENNPNRQNNIYNQQPNFNNNQYNNYNQPNFNNNQYNNYNQQNSNKNIETTPNDTDNKFSSLSKKSIYIIVAIFIAIITLLIIGVVGFILTVSDLFNLSAVGSVLFEYMFY